MHSGHFTPMLADGTLIGGRNRLFKLPTTMVIKAHSTQEMNGTAINCGRTK
jgi:hypothetical protein